VQDSSLPVSYANAFIKPVRPQGDRSLMDESVSALTQHMERVIGAFALEARRAYVSTGEWVLPGAERVHSLPALLEGLPLPSEVTTDGAA
jgi:CRISPR system Cascade subunit CasC